MTNRHIVCMWLLVQGLGMSASIRADPVASPDRAIAATRIAQPPRRCGSSDERVTVLRMTTIEDGLRVEYEFIRPGPRTWTHSNRPLLRQLGLQLGGRLCLPRERATPEAD